MSETEQAPLTEREQEKWRELHQKPFEDLTDEEVTSKIRLSVKRRFGPGEWAVCFEFTAPNGRRADAIAVNLLPSRNFKIVGFEFKASRSDWLSEKKEGQKADYFVQLCDEWFVVAGRTGIVKEKELPDGWGLLELKPNSEQLWELQDSDLKDYQNGVEADRQFWTRFLKKTVGDESNYSKADLREARKRGYEEAREEGVKKFADREVRRLEKDAENWRLLKENGFDNLYSMSEERVEKFKLAVELIDVITSDDFGSVIGSVQMLRDDFDRQRDDVVGELYQFERGVKHLRDAIEDPEKFTEVAEVGDSE